jgi:LasA protease
MERKRVIRVRWIVLSLVIVLAFSMLGGCARDQNTARDRDSTPRSGTTAASEAAGKGAAELPATAAPAAGLPDMGFQGEPTPPPQVYFVQAGDTLYGIATRFGCNLDELIRANGISDPNALQIGQQLNIPTTSIETGPDVRLLPNSEFVHSPAYVDFDTVSFSNAQGGYLAAYQERVGDQVLSGPEIVDYVVGHYSVGPRLLLAILEMRGGWVTNPNPSGDAYYYPMGYRGGGWDSLHYQLAWAADKLNQGYYDWRGRGMVVKTWGDGTTTSYAPTLNAATAGLQYFFSLDATRSQWETWVGEGPGSFLEAYRRLFGDPAQVAIEPLIPADTTSPALSLPWSQSELWYYTGGPHGAWNDGSAWAAIDFVPDEGYLGCQIASSWATAAAPGLVIYSQDGEVKIDLDGDRHEETGWVLFYLHVASQDRVSVGTRVAQGDPIGHPSCEGGFSDSTHLHFARKYNGEWIAADGPLPLVLSGWQFYAGSESYEGSASRGLQERTACECWKADFNGLTAGR